MQPQTARCTSQGNRELMPKKQVLDFKLAPRPKQISGKRREQTEDRKHRVERCADSASWRESAPDGVFGNDNGFPTESR
jgi:hypothetical protein